MSKVLYNTKIFTIKSTSNNWVYAHRPNANNVVVVLPETEDEVLF